MKAIILTAGYGRRMRPLTDTNHKTLLKIAGVPIINRIIDVLLECNIRDIVIVTGYLKEKMEAHLNNAYPSINISYIHNERYAETNNIYSLALAIEHVTIDQDILLIESDLIFDPSVLKRLLNNNQKNVALVDKYGQGMDGTVVTVEDGKVTNVIPPHLQAEDFDFSDKYKTLNIYKFSQEFASTIFKKLLSYYARVIDDNCYYELILGILIFMQREVIHAEILDNEKWAEVDDPNDLGLASFMFDKKRQASVLQSTFGGYWNYDIIDFCFIRNMYFPTGAVLAEIKNNMEGLLHNYGSKQSILNQKLAYYLLCKKENIQVLNGASQAYPFLKHYFSDKKVLLPGPTFGEYNRIFPNASFYSDYDGFDTEEIAQKVEATDVIVFVNPNNPTGSCLSSNWIYGFAKNHPKKTIIVDESFIEFSCFKSMLDSLEKNPLDNVIIIKSLSKSLGMPGLRLGYMYSSNANFMTALQEETPIWNLNSMAEFFLEIVLKHRNSIKASFKQTIQDRVEFIQELKECALIEKVFPSEADFILVRLRGSRSLANKVVLQLLDVHKIFVKDISSKFPDGTAYLRLAVRLPEENKQLVACLKELVEITSIVASAESV